MAIEITIPRLGWSMDEGIFGEWLKADGDFVEAGEALFTLESEKALQEIESVDSGILKLLTDAPQAGDMVTVGRRIAFLVDRDEQLPPIAPQATEPVASTAAHSTAPILGQPNTDHNHSDSLEQPPAISPRAARLARQLNVDWTTLTGSGRTGRIREADVRAAANHCRTAVTVTPRAASASAVPDPAGRPGGQAAARVRRVIAERMLRSVRQTAPVTLTMRIDATHLVGLREQFKNAYQEFVPAYQDIIAKLVAITLQSHPGLQQQWIDDNLVAPDGIHIGFAVQTTTGLLVPVIRNCDQLSLSELTRSARNLIERARAGTCTQAEMSNGTFTITNLGAFGIDAFTPIINTPETAILGLGAIRREAVVLDDDRIMPRPQMTLSLTFDHRVLDGAPAAQFLQALRARIENPGPSLIA